MHDYRVVVESEKSRLESVINTLLNNGFLLAGGICFVDNNKYNGTFFSQAVYKPTRSRKI